MGAVGTLVDANVDRESTRHAIRALRPRHNLSLGPLERFKL